jgi:signal transduction histidine kinase
MNLLAVFSLMVMLAAQVHSAVSVPVENHICDFLSMLNHFILFLTAAFVITMEIWNALSKNTRSIKEICTILSLLLIVIVLDTSIIGCLQIPEKMYSNLALLAGSLFLVATNFYVWERLSKENISKHIKIVTTVVLFILVCLTILHTFMFINDYAFKIMWLILFLSAIAFFGYLVGTRAHITTIVDYINIAIYSIIILFLTWEYSSVVFNIANSKWSVFLLSASIMIWPLSKLINSFVEYTKAAVTATKQLQDLNLVFSEKNDLVKRMQSDLLEKNYIIGSAEIATGTLHNIGNILNNVSTSVYLLSSIHSRGALEKFKKANMILTQNENDMSNFLKNDKGSKLIEYYKLIEKLFGEEIDKTDNIVSELDKKINLIIGILTTQQNYAGFSSTLESLDILKIIDDVLLMEKASLEKATVQIVKKIRKVPNINAQKNKTMHVLINLIKNGKEAMMANDILRRVLTISVYDNFEYVVVEINDCGTGIASENTSRLFTYGFTTKSNGHGFGLYSCAQYMKEMNGLITAESAGLGLGSTMILKFRKSAE